MKILIAVERFDKIKYMMKQTLEKSYDGVVLDSELGDFKTEEMLKKGAKD